MATQCCPTTKPTPLVVLLPCTDTVFGVQWVQSQSLTIKPIKLVEVTNYLPISCLRDAGSYFLSCNLSGVWIADGEESAWASQGPMTISGNSAPLGGGMFHYSPIAIHCTAFIIELDSFSFLICRSVCGKWNIMGQFLL